MKMFSEIYGCYFTVVSRISEQSNKGLTKAEIEQLVTTRKCNANVIQKKLEKTKELC